MMNDPQVQALIYRIEHDDSVDYSNARPDSWDMDEFRVSADGLQVRFDLHEHHANEKDAREAIAEYIRAWEFRAQLKHGPNGFSLRFEEAVVVDRNPDPVDWNHVPLRASGRGGRETAGGRLTVTSKPDSYPSPSADIVLSADAESMHRRYMGYRTQREPLPGMAFFCLSVLEDPEERSKERVSRKRKAAAQRLNVDEDVLAKVGHLSSTSGGTEARKREGIDKPLGSLERRFLEAAIKRLILRVAERAAIPGGDLAQIKAVGSSLFAGASR